MEKALNDMADDELLAHLAALRARLAELARPVLDRHRVGPGDARVIEAAERKEARLLPMRIAAAASVAKERGLL